MAYVVGKARIIDSYICLEKTCTLPKVTALSDNPLSNFKEFCGNKYDVGVRMIFAYISNT